ncbi:putative uncharacterized protein [Parachlamydia acanthamoebae UV-7]|uniref:Lantibiotic biosynthesis protein dehydration domain-containing protein n=2 Tax=Parachlamydia acanthamoebae TaxID=83552 RepID=F8KXV7_PARAV|nr:DUF4135 domain-containing protein [Parachlamydia acanthamoebae]KIA78606.1 hypothetical protein DB43_DS00330 [Parachlamydia acanthamoebae]CCB85687.1 putative uncharacterized protein [Parachlamydia acanthamoebae UV-7]
MNPLSLNQEVQQTVIDSPKQPISSDLPEKHVEPQVMSSHQMINFICDKFLERQTINKQISEAENELDDIPDQKSEVAKKLKSKIRELEKKDEHLEQAMKESEEQLKSQFIEGRELPVTLSRMNLAMSDSQIKYFKGILTSKIGLWKAFEGRAKDTIEEHKATILEQFGNGSKNSADVKFDLKVLGGDDHNNGQSPLLVTFTFPDKSPLKVVYKPRSAQTDAAILDLFAKLNSLHPDLKSHGDLPQYKIQDIDGGKGSIWEFIEGQPLHTEASSTINKIQDQDVRIRAEENLIRLEQICSRAGITDLHMENVLLTRDGQWVPIDLEVVEPGHATGLLSSQASKDPKFSPELKQDEIMLIDKFLDQQEKRVSRYVIVATASFIQASTDPSTIEPMAQEVLETLSKNNEFKLTVDPKQFIKQFSACMEKGDVPFFTKNSDAICFGHFAEENIIAIRKPNK